MHADGSVTWGTAGRSRRQPHSLERAGEEPWLDPRNRDLAALLDVVAPYPAAEMSAYAVSPLVNSVANDLPECIQRAA